jgi:hypothetical protein
MKGERKMNDLVRQSKLFVKRNASTILTCVGGVGVVTTSVLAVKATPKALALLDEAKEEKGEELTKMEVVRVAGPAYIPAVISGVSTLACIFGANILNKKQQASLASAYALLDSSYKDYKKKVAELYGNEANAEIRKELAKDKYEEVEDKEILQEDDGKQLFYDAYSERYFRATNETVLRAEYTINKRLHEDSYVSLNELYNLLGIAEVDYGDVVGWSSWIDFYHEKIELEDGMECFIINATEPSTEFEDY